MHSSGRGLALLALLLLLPPVEGAVSPRQIERAERTWIKASGLLLSDRLASGSWEAAADPALSGLLGSEFGVLTTTLGDGAAKRAAAQSGWCRALGCWLDSLGIGPADTVAVTLSGSFPGLNLAVLLTLEAAEIPYRCVSSLGASSHGANLPDFNWPRIEELLKARGLLTGGSLCITPGGSNDRMSSSLLETVRVAETELRRHPHSLHPGSLRQAVELRQELLGPPEHLSLLINVGGGHAALGTTPFGRGAGGGLLGEEERLLLESAEGNGIPGLMQLWFEQGLPVLHFSGIVELARAWGLPTEHLRAATPDSLRIGCFGRPPRAGGEPSHD
jgi:poly-gamma-glutamate system protein